MELQLNQKRLISVKEAAELFSIGTKSMYQYAKDGEGQYSVSVGSRWLISPDKFEEYLLKPITELREELETNKNEQGVRFVTCMSGTPSVGCMRSAPTMPLSGTQTEVIR